MERVLIGDGFLAIFRNEITTILTPSTSEGDEWRRWGWSRFEFWRSLIMNPQCNMGSFTETVTFQVYEILKINHKLLQFF